MINVLAAHILPAWLDRMWEMIFAGPFLDCSSDTDLPDKTKLIRQMVGRLVTCLSPRQQLKQQQQQQQQQQHSYRNFMNKGQSWAHYDQPISSLIQRF